MKRTIAILTASVLAVLSLSACGDKTPSNPAVGQSEGTTGNYWAQKISQLEAEQAKTSTTKWTMSTEQTTTTTTAEKPTTTKRSWFTFASQSTTSSRSTSTTKRSTTTTTTTMYKPTITMSQEIKDMIYNMVYQQKMLEYNSRLREQQALKNRVTQIENRIANLRNQASNLYVQYQTDLRQLAIKCEAMGMSTNSGYYKGQADSLESQYKANLAPISAEIDELEEELAEAEKEVGATIEEPTQAEIQEAYLIELEEYKKKYNLY